MQRRTFLKNTGALGVFTLITPTGFLQAAGKKTSIGLEEGFRQPPSSAFPQTWWHWMNGNVTKEGITLDLEAMKEAGIGGFQNFDAGTLIPKGPVVYLSPEWVELKKHTIREAERLGLEFTMHNCPGWSSSGGPWITAEKSMQQLTWSEAFVHGGQQVNVVLPKPFSRLDYYRDVCVLAFPSLPGEDSLATQWKMATTSQGTMADINNLLGKTSQWTEVRPAADGSPAYLQLEFAATIRLSSIAFTSEPITMAGQTPAGPGANTISVEVSGDGLQFAKAAVVQAGGGFGSLPEANFFTSDFTAVSGKFIRLVSSQPRSYGQLYFSGAGRLANWKTKANYEGGNWRTSPLPETAGNFSKEEIIDPARVLNLTDFLDKEGRLNWNAPAGNWTVLRFGFTPIGTLNRSAPDTGIGLECDKFSRSAIEFHFSNMMENLLPALGPLAGKGKTGLLIDSWEVGMQNWTDGFEKEFQNRRGYDLLRYLPAMTGRVMVGPDTTENFLWDLRRTQADVLADHYYGRFAELCRQHGIIAYTEPYDRGPMEEMQIGARVDVNMGEFWNGLSTLFQNNYTMRRTTKLAASIAHVNGQKLVGAESFTGEPASAKWQEYPFAMKATGDKMFTQGLNRIIFHRYAHQPHPTALPGMTMGPWGIHFDRTNTWWKPGKAWMQYLSRCQYLLQQGLFVADLLYHTGEAIGTYTRVNPDELTPSPPIGYDYDLVNTETLLMRARMENGRIVFPDSMGYRLLILQDFPGIRLELLQKIYSLLKEGLTLVGARPAHTLGLQSGKENEFDQLVNAIWGEPDGKTKNQKQVGKGQVFWGMPIGEIVKKLSVSPDVEISSRSGDAPITWIHRQDGDADLYFLANQRRQTEELVCSFRVEEKQPELWDPVTGSMTPVRMFGTEAGRISMPLQLGPCGSQFVVFRSRAEGRRIHRVTKDNKSVLSTKIFSATERKIANDIVNNFTISFWVKPEMDIMLSAADAIIGGEPWTDHFTIYPYAASTIFGKGHEAVGLTAGRNGVAIWTREGGKPKLGMSAKTAISGWTHIALAYKERTPALFVNGKLEQRGNATDKTVHPGIGQALLEDGASYYNGDMTSPQVFPEALDDDRIRQLALALPQIELYKQGPVEISANGQAGMLFWENGKYQWEDDQGKKTWIEVSGLKKIILSDAWKVSFPSGMGAPEQVELKQLASLHRHDLDGVKFFSGTATYYETFRLASSFLQKGSSVYLDLGRVEVIAEIIVNNRNLGILWQRPYRMDITEALKTGNNQLEIKVTNLWPNRLIGDEQVPEMYQFPQAGSARGAFASLSAGGIQELPDWYREGKPKPEDGRVTFTTWKHYQKDSPLLESGLIGPVIIRSAMLKHFK